MISAKAWTFSKSTSKTKRSKPYPDSKTQKKRLCLTIRVFYCILR